MLRILIGSRGRFSVENLDPPGRMMLYSSLNYFKLWFLMVSNFREQNFLVRNYELFNKEGRYDIFKSSISSLGEILCLFCRFSVSVGANFYHHQTSMWENKNDAPYLLFPKQRCFKIKIISLIFPRLLPFCLFSSRLKPWATLVIGVVSEAGYCTENITGCFGAGTRTRAGSTGHRGQVRMRTTPSVKCPSYS